jgi:hypothetical protein
MRLVNKILRRIVLSIIVLFVILWAVCDFLGERILKIGIETAATKALGVGVYIDDVDLTIFKGTVGIKDMVVRNPPGYTHKNLLELGYGRIKVSISSLLGDTVHVEELRLYGINLVIEQKALSNNLQDIINSISSIPAKDKQESAPSGKRLQIDNLEIADIKVKVKLLPVPGKADTVTLNLAPIRMSNLGTDNKLSTAVLSSKIMLAIANGITKQGVGVLPEKLVGTMKSTLDKTINLGKAASKEGKKLIDVGAEVVEGFKSLLKPGKKE